MCIRDRNNDDSIRLIRKRLKLSQINDEQDKRLFVYNRSSFKITNSVDRDALISDIRKKKAGLVIFDTLRQTHLGDENLSLVMSNVLAQFKKVARATNCAILLVHHDSKGFIGKTAVTSAMGSITIIGDCYASYRLRPGNQKRIIIMEGGKSKSEELGKNLTLQFAESLPCEHMFKIIEGKNTINQEDVTANVLAVFQLNPNPGFTCDEFVVEFLKNDVTTPKAKIVEALKILKQDGYISTAKGKANNRKEYYLNDQTTLPTNNDP